MSARVISNSVNTGINVMTDKGTIAANLFSEDGRIGIKTEFIAEDDRGQKTRPSVTLEFGKDDTLRILVHDNTGTEPVRTIEYKDGKAVPEDDT